MHVRMHMLMCMKTLEMKAGALDKCLADMGISRNELARRMGVDSATPYRIQSGRTQPGPKFIAALMDVTGKEFDELFVVGES